MIDENRESINTISPIMGDELLEDERIMVDPDDDEYYANVIVKREALEGRDYTIISEKLFGFLYERYGGIPIPRFTYYKNEA